MWHSEAPAPLWRCGIDAEQIGRFTRFSTGPGNPLPLVFTENEVACARSGATSAQSLCASFCCKEALFKALEEPYNFIECELLPDFTQEVVAPTLSETLIQQYGISAIECRIKLSTPNEIVAIVYLFTYHDRLPS